MLVTYLATITKGCQMADELIQKYSAAYGDKQRFVFLVFVSYCFSLTLSTTGEEVVLSFDRIKEKWETFRFNFNHFQH